MSYFEDTPSTGSGTNVMLAADACGGLFSFFDAYAQPDAPHDVIGTTDAPVDGGALDPDLALPAAGGTTCSTPGSEMGCPAITVCRIATPTGGRCEGCSACANLGATCSASSDCDILFQCYQGKCTNICPLGTSYCGAVSDCLDVGHATYGVCRP